MNEPSKSSGTPGSFPDIEKPGRDVKAKPSWVAEAEQTLRAIREGETDALVVQGDVADKLYALKSFEEMEKADAELKSEGSERRRSDAARRESERRFETLATHAPVGIFISDAAGNCIYVNRRYCEILGMPPEDVMGQGWANALHPEDRDRVLSQWHEALRTAGAFVLECRYRWPNGKSVWVAARSIALRGRDGKVTERIGTLSDVTDRKTAELALKEANRRTQTVLDASPLAILSMDPLGRIMGWNQGAERMFGWSEQEVIGRVCPTVPDEGLDDFHDMIRFVLSGAPWAGKVRSRRKNSGEVIRASISAAPLLDA